MVLGVYAALRGLAAHWAAIMAGRRRAGLGRAGGLPGQ